MNVTPLLKAAAVHRDLMVRGVTPVLHDSFPAGDGGPAGGEHTRTDVDAGRGGCSVPSPRCAGSPPPTADAAV